jgi:hypothetical protein
VERPVGRVVEADVPPPPEPPDDVDELPPDFTDEPVGVPASVVSQRDPDAVAVDMLTEQLRARRIT